jgi:mono/diheme cytochrome c family protein
MLLGVTGKLTVQGSTYTGQMPPFAQLSDAEIVAIGSYERGSFGNTMAPLTRDWWQRYAADWMGAPSPGGDEELGPP